MSELLSDEGESGAAKAVSVETASAQSELANSPTKKKRKKVKAKPRKGLKRFISLRRAMQLGIGVTLWLGVEYLGWNLLWIVIAGSAMGIVLGKVFCRWMCPLGFLMETITNVGDDEAQLNGMYMYFKLGCPIAWISGMLNKISFIKVKLDDKQCISCGKCDQACYISTHSEKHSLFKDGRVNASAHYSCSRCLKCVEACPTGALNFSSGAQYRLRSDDPSPEAINTDDANAAIEAQS